MEYPILTASLLGMVILYYLVKIVDNAYAMRFKKPVYTHFYIVRKRLAPEQRTILEEHFDFYNALKPIEKKNFEHRLCKFLQDKKFYGRQDLVVTQEMRILVGATAVMLTFGMRNYYLGILEKVIIYPEAYYSNITHDYHKGEFNPRLKALVISWKDFKDGYDDATDNLNLGIHEFTHILQLNSRRFKDISASLFSDGYKVVEDILKDDNYRNNLMASEYFRDYAFTNKYEFLAVLIENFIETPLEFKSNFPKLYRSVKQMLNFNFAGY